MTPNTSQANELIKSQRETIEREEQSQEGCSAGLEVSYRAAFLSSRAPQLLQVTVMNIFTECLFTECCLFYIENGALFWSE